MYDVKLWTLICYQHTHTYATDINKAFFKQSTLPRSSGQEKNNEVRAPKSCQSVKYVQQIPSPLVTAYANEDEPCWRE